MSDVPPVTDEDPPEDARGTEAWKASRKAIERIIDVVLTLEEPRPVSWIADEAHVAEQTARDHLSMLAEDLGILVETKTQGVRKYRPDKAYLRFREVRTILERHDRDEVESGITEMKEQIEECKEEYDCENVIELRERAASDDTSADEAREFFQVASEWESLEHTLSIYQDALEEFQKYQGEGPRITA